MMIFISNDEFFFENLTTHPTLLHEFVEITNCFDYIDFSWYVKTNF